MSDQDLLPCQCGSRDLYYAFSYLGTCITCDYCSARGPISRTPEEAAAAWNRGGRVMWELVLDDIPRYPPCTTQEDAECSAKRYTDKVEIRPVVVRITPKVET